MIMMTVQELYNWAKENDLLDTEIYYGNPDYSSAILGLKSVEQVVKIEALTVFVGDWKDTVINAGVIIC